MRNRKTKIIQFECEGSYLKFLIIPPPVGFTWPVKVKVLVSQSCPTLALLVTPSMGFSRQESWSGLPFPSPGDLPHPGIQPRSPALQADSAPSEPPGKPLFDLGKTIYSMVQSQTNELRFAWNSYIMSCLVEREISSLVRLERD